LTNKGRYLPQGKRRLSNKRCYDTQHNDTWQWRSLRVSWHSWESFTRSKHSSLFRSNQWRIHKKVL